MQSLWSKLKHCSDLLFLFAGARRSRRQTAGIARTDSMFVTFPVHKRQRMMIALMQPVEDTVDQDDSVPPQPVAVDDAA